MSAGTSAAQDGAQDGLLAAVLAQHRLVTKTQCGAVSVPLVHRHGSESDARPGPLRVLTCSEPDGHDGLHRDCLCCYSFQTFEDWQVADRRPRTFDVCSDGGLWPCDTVLALQEAAAR